MEADHIWAGLHRAQKLDLIQQLPHHALRVHLGPCLAQHLESVGVSCLQVLREVHHAVTALTQALLDMPTRGLELGGGVGIVGNVGQALPVVDNGFGGRERGRRLLAEPASSRGHVVAGGLGGGQRCSGRHGGAPGGWLSFRLIPKPECVHAHGSGGWPPLSWLPGWQRPVDRRSARTARDPAGPRRSGQPIIASRAAQGRRHAEAGHQG
mmetsp:Transcript_46620/g.116610  ORF Transcript_46620/g.116610 Transcript_46620/m.116610 type:complete len:210 (+) Transcript_46620:972-1601(+)